MGRYRGRHSFDQLSHLRSCMIKQLNMEVVNNMRYPPHTLRKLSWARFFLLTPPSRLSRMLRLGALAALAALAAFMLQVRRKEQTADTIVTILTPVLLVRHPTCVFIYSSLWHISSYESHSQSCIIAERAERLKKVMAGESKSFFDDSLLSRSSVICY